MDRAPQGASAMLFWSAPWSGSDGRHPALLFSWGVMMMEIGNSKTGAVPDRGWHVVRIVVAMVLLVAAATKCHQCCTGPIPSSGIFSAKWFVICLVEAEWLGSVGLVLLAGILTKPTWAAALACFSAFTLVSLGKGLMGEASCGCFGRWELNPYVTATMDATIVVALLYWRPKPIAADFQQMFARATCVLVIWLAGGVPRAIAPYWVIWYEWGNAIC